jgi:hypothetical protein
MLANHSGLQWSTVRNFVAGLGADVAYGDDVVRVFIFNIPKIVLINRLVHS